MMSDIEQRVNKLEFKQETLENKNETLDDKLDALQVQVNTKLDTISASIMEMKLERSRQMGFIGGIVFIITALFALAGLALKKFF